LLSVLLLVCWSSQQNVASNSQPTPLESCDERRPMVETKQGSICGTYCPDGPLEVCGKKVEAVKTRKYKAFTGIPFAKPPLAELRFKSPVSGDPWINYRDGSWMPPMCPQQDFEAFLDTGNFSIKGQEDCLFLNVYAPEINIPATGLPVMVWIHGGGFSFGGIQEYFADKLMTRDIILVSIQYRLGIFGWLSTDDEVAPGNLAIKDQELALRWVKENIAGFGGDPSQVTIFGESAGGISVHYQILNPQAKGLFSRAILQSGTALFKLFKTIDQRDNAFEVATRLGCSIEKYDNDYKSEELLDCLQKIPASSFIEVAFSFYEAGFPIPAYEPRYGEASLPGVPAELLRDGKYNMVDIIMGIMQHEGGMFTKLLFTNPGAFENIATNFSNSGHVFFYMNESETDVAKQIFQYYMGGVREFNEDDADALTEMFGDYFFDMLHDYSIDLHARDSLYGKNIYAYEVKHRGDGGMVDLIAPHIGKNWVNHGDDELYLFKAYSDIIIDTNNPENKKLESTWLDLWTNFATYGNPTPDRSLGFTWEPVTLESSDHLVLKPEPYMEADTRCQRRKFFSSLNIDVNRALFPDRIGAGPDWKPWKIQDLKKC